MEHIVLPFIRIKGSVCNDTENNKGFWLKLNFLPRPLLMGSRQTKGKVWPFYARLGIPSFLLLSFKLRTPATEFRTLRMGVWLSMFGIIKALKYSKRRTEMRACHAFWRGGMAVEYEVDGRKYAVPESETKIVLPIFSTLVVVLVLIYRLD